jgi:hypothetical protein
MTDSARDILDRRLAAGEIGLAEFDELAKRLESKPDVALPVGDPDPRPRQRPPTGQWQGLPSSPDLYERRWKTATLVALSIAVIVPIAMIKVVVPWIFSTDWGMRILFWLASVFQAVLGGNVPADRVLEITLGGVSFFLAILATVSIGNLMVQFMLEAVDTNATDVNSDLVAVVDRRNRAFPMLIRGTFAPGRPGIALNIGLTNLFMLVTCVACVVWARLVP